MKLAALVLAIIIYLSFVPSINASVNNDIKVNSQGGGSSVKVNLKNNVNTGNYNYSSSSQTDTNVNIKQTGEGTSSVKINGKEWKLEGPGEIDVNEGTRSEEHTPTTGGSEDVSITESPTPTNESPP